MFAATLSRPAFAIARIFAPRRATTAPRLGPMPTWLSDPKLSEHLLRDTGLTPEDLGGQPTYDAAKPFFMQRNFW